MYIDDDEESVEIVPQVSEYKDNALSTDDVVCIFLFQKTRKLSKKFLRHFKDMSVLDKKDISFMEAAPTDIPKVEGKSEGSSKASSILLSLASFK